ncbi:unnamed protein product [Protopolystoma xenopodis]|uniref:Uncharacterized protein n=1 Tax=Protopolystoma xenopodis TaxID=117903 RepID=A0A448XPQ7_9PLAT|nr:unnamed protein product [Protopolystoma xenopodis]
MESIEWSFVSVNHPKSSSGLGLQKQPDVCECGFQTNLMERSDSGGQLKMPLRQQTTQSVLAKSLDAPNSRSSSKIVFSSKRVQD